MNELFAPAGTYRNPADRWCFRYCRSCGRCSDRGRMSVCGGCSGRFDPDGHRVPNVDDYCRCTEGILQWVTQEGRKIQVPLMSDPFGGVVKYESISQDEADWESYLQDTREKLDDPNYDPISFTDGTSTTNWMRDRRQGQ